MPFWWWPRSLSMLALRPLSNPWLPNGSISPTAATSSIKQSLSEMKPATRRRRRHRLPLHQDFHPALETAEQHRPWQRRCECQQKQQQPPPPSPPTSIPSYRHGHHWHEGPIPRRLAIRWPPCCFFKKNKVAAPLDLHDGCSSWWALLVGSPKPKLHV